MFNSIKNNWLGNKFIELTLILLVPFWCLLIIAFIPEKLIQTDSLPEYWWLFLVVFIDVSHVYSTLYRTYINKNIVLAHKNLFMGLPVILFVLSTIIHSLNTHLFWTCLAYIAVFHFIRQQYGIFKIYSRNEKNTDWKNQIDKIAIYSSTLLPILYWHLSSDRVFTWFVKDDFLIFPFNPITKQILIILFWLMLTIYIISELHSSRKNKQINIQKNLVLIGTALSWYFGIVYFNSDLVFSILNIACHGIPYMALVWIHGKKTNQQMSNSLLNILYGKFSLLFFLLPILILAIIEENLWDSFVWKEHQDVLFFSKYLNFRVSKSTLNIIVPLLTLPQLFHYVIDGFIWKIKNDKFEWTRILK